MLGLFKYYFYRNNNNKWTGTTGKYSNI
ncbi:hypothetical protein NC652_007121 [Populus alba x Populus x berolinensis]|nr:hypothetical protein NC651_006868 [Populus alba x Populus x berolinensis]KAJ6955924.1 hypothetical protein NC652_007121 [Populus alba x Populus x berolinensis]